MGRLPWKLLAGYVILNLGCDGAVTDSLHGMDESPHSYSQDSVCVCVCVCVCLCVYTLYLHEAFVYLCILRMCTFVHT